MLNETASQLDPGFLDEFGHRWSDAWDQRDGKALAALCTEDIEFYDPAIGEIHGRRGGSQLGEYLRAGVPGLPI